MKLLATFKGGSTRLLNLKPPLRYFDGAVMYHIQDATGMDFYFNTSDGTFDGTGMGCTGCSAEEVEALVESMKNTQAGNIQ